MDIDTAALQRLIDKDAIRDVTMRYSRGIDRHDDALFASAYHPDGRDDHGTYIGGIEGLIEHCNVGHEKNWTIHQHYALNQSIDLDGDAAHVETYFIVALRRKDGAIDLFGGRWVDRMERRDGRWAIAERIVVTDWNGEVNAPDAPVDLDLFITGTWNKDDVSYQRPLRIEREERALVF